MLQLFTTIYQSNYGKTLHSLFHLLTRLVYKKYYFLWLFLYSFHWHVTRRASFSCLFFYGKTGLASSKWTKENIGSLRVPVFQIPIQVFLSSVNNKNVKLYNLYSNVNDIVSLHYNQNMCFLDTYITGGGL